MMADLVGVRESADHHRNWTRFPATKRLSKRTDQRPHSQTNWTKCRGLHMTEMKMKNVDVLTYHHPDWYSSLSMLAVYRRHARRSHHCSRGASVAECRVHLVLHVARQGICAAKY